MGERSWFRLMGGDTPAGSEPVAWMLEWVSEGKPMRATTIGKPETIVGERLTPLYTHPNHSPEVAQIVAENERLRRLCGMCQYPEKPSLCPHSITG